MKKFLSLLLFFWVFCGCASMFIPNFEVTKFDPNPNIVLPVNDNKKSLSLNIDESIKDAFVSDGGNFTASVTGFRESLETGFRNGFKDYFRIEPSKSTSDFTINLTKVECISTSKMLQIAFKATLTKKNGETVKASAGRVEASGGKDVTAVAKRAFELMYEQIAIDLFTDKK